MLVGNAGIEPTLPAWLRIESLGFGEGTKTIETRIPGGWLRGYGLGANPRP